MVVERPKRIARNRVRVPVLLTVQQVAQLARVQSSLNRQLLSNGTREQWRCIETAANNALVKADADGLLVPPEPPKGCKAVHPDTGIRCSLGRTHVGRMHRTKAGVQFR